MNCSNRFWAQFSKKLTAPLTRDKSEYRTVHCVTNDFSNKLWKIRKNIHKSQFI